MESSGQYAKLDEWVTRSRDEMAAALQVFGSVHLARHHQQRLTYRAVKQTKVTACEATAISLLLVRRSFGEAATILCSVGCIGTGAGAGPARA